MLSKIKKIIPRPLLSVYHYVLAVLADFIYGSPSDKLIVIGVTGTTGKSSVVFLIAKILEKAGYKVGASSTFMFKIDKEEWLNDKKMIRKCFKKLIVLVKDYQDKKSSKVLWHLTEV